MTSNTEGKHERETMTLPYTKTTPIAMNGDEP